MAKNLGRKDKCDAFIQHPERTEGLLYQPSCVLMT